MNDHPIQLELAPTQVRLLRQILTHYAEHGDTSGYDQDRSGWPGAAWTAADWQALSDLRQLLEARTLEPA